MSSKKSFYLYFSILFILVSLTAAEIGMRIYHYAKGRQRWIWVPDRHLGYALTPYHRFVYRFDEGDQHLQIPHHTNALGFLSEEISLQKPEGITRVVMLGDSFTEALQVKEEENYCSLLEKYLNEHRRSDEKRYEVINAGVSGYSPFMEYNLYTKRVRDLKPDIVILQIFANDVFNDHEYSAMSVVDEHDLPVKIYRNFPRHREDPKRTAKRLERTTLADRINDLLFNHSRFYEYMMVKVGEWWEKSASVNKSMHERPEFNHDNYFFPIQEDNALFHDTAFLEKSVAQTKFYILEIKKEVEKDGATFGFFYIPLYDQLVTKKHKEQPRFYFSRSTNTYLNLVLKDLAQANNIPYDDIYDIFKTKQWENYFFSSNLHLTAEGHEVVAQELEKKFFIDHHLEKMGNP